MTHVAILIDGEFMKKRLSRRLKRFPDGEAVMGEISRIRSALGSPALYRVFYYTANPLTEKVTNPLDGSVVDFARTGSYRRNRRLITSLERLPDVAVRRGELVSRGWALRPRVADRLMKGNPKRLNAGDLTPQIDQKGVDMRIGLDIASLALKRLVSEIVVVTGDSDIVPALKFARREGLRVHLDLLGGGGRRELRVHADRVIS
ncbi:NYN domain-containing protein [Candidatus Palauibacter sp.]|uniref:NYN domain-containing protein n=1 Tax=Candidatus Palauibacter sp. TaxID=3101350 RepID=UPI003B5BCB86